MGQKTWNLLASNVEVPAKPQGRWTLAVEYVGDKKLLRIEVTNAGSGWSYAPERHCGADGECGTQTGERSLLMEKAPVGALIGKIGGSTAGQEDGSVFLAGNFCLIRLKENEEGPLFLTINDHPAGFGDNSGSLGVSVYEAL